MEYIIEEKRRLKRHRPPLHTHKIMLVGGVGDERNILIVLNLQSTLDGILIYGSSNPSEAYSAIHLMLRVQW
jgi:hypothetical protein